jgi:hypothetical protein
MIGMGGQASGELAALYGKGAANRSEAETKRMVELAGKYQEGIQSMINSQDLSTRNIGQQLESMQGTYLAGIAKQSGKATAAGESGPVVQGKFNHSVDSFGVAVGKFAAAAEGVSKSGLYEIAKDTLEIVAGLAIFKKGGSFLSNLFGKDRAAAKVAGVGGEAGEIGAASGGFRASISEIVNALKAGSSTLAKSVPTVGESFSGIKTGLMAGIRGARFVLTEGLGPEIGAVFSAIEEIFTGDMTNALSLGDGFFGRLLGAVVAGFNGIFTSVSRLVDDSINWVMEGLGFSFRSNATKIFDKITDKIVAGWKMLLMYTMRGIASGLETFVGWFGGKDAPWVKSLRKGADDIDASLQAQAANRVKLDEDQGSTLRSIGEKNQQSQKKVADATQAQADRLTTASSNLVTSLNGLYSSADSAVQAVQSNVGATAQAATPSSENRPNVGATAPAQVATPSSENRPSVTPPEVNKAESTETTQTGAATTTGAPQPTLADVITVLQQQLDVAKKMMVALAEKNDGTENSPRVSLPPVQGLTSSILGVPRTYS